MEMNGVGEYARQLWSEALGVQIEMDTDFFFSGGHSFLAIDIVAKLSEHSGVKIPLRTLFDHPQFAEFVDAMATLFEKDSV